MRRLLVVPCVSAAVVAGTFAAGAVGAGSAPAAGHDVAKTTIGPGPLPTTPLPTVPPPTVGLPTAPPTLPLATVPLPTQPPVTVSGVPTTEAPALSPESLAAAYTIFGLDEARLQCIMSAMAPFEPDDAVALQAVQSCGVQLMPILRGAVHFAQRSDTFLDPTATTVALPPVIGVDALPDNDAFFIGFILLLLPEETACLATGLAGATDEEDTTALAIMQRCAVPLGQTLQMLSFALLDDPDALPTGTTVPATVAALPSVPSLPVGTPTTAPLISPDDPLVDQFQEMLLDQEGIALDDAQAACLLSQIQVSDVAPDDLTAMMTLMEVCGITLTDLLPG